MRFFVNTKILLTLFIFLSVSCQNHDDDSLTVVHYKPCSCVSCQSSDNDSLSHNLVGKWNSVGLTYKFGDMDLDMDITLEFSDKEMYFETVEKRLNGVNGNHFTGCENYELKDDTLWCVWWIFFQGIQSPSANSLPQPQKPSPHPVQWLNNDKIMIDTIKYERMN